VIVNPSARSGRALGRLERLRRRRHDVEWIESRSAAHLQSLVRAAESDGLPWLGLAGGDGTLALAAAALDDGNRVPWRILPVGSGNDFAAHLGIARPELCDERLRPELHDGNLRRVDAGRANGRAFVCVASLGLDAPALEIVHGSRWPRGKLLNLYAAVRGLCAFRPERVRVTWDDGVFEGTIRFVAVTNTRSYAGGFRVSPGAQLDDGKLDLCVIGATGRARLLGNFPRLLRGTHGALPEVLLAQSRRVLIESETPLAVALDGELPSLMTPVELTCRPSQLSVLT
jgi:diacylglycerol kinase (ATP)